MRLSKSVWVKHCHPHPITIVRCCRIYFTFCLVTFRNNRDNTFCASTLSILGSIFHKVPRLLVWTLRWSCPGCFWRNNCHWIPDKSWRDPPLPRWHFLLLWSILWNRDHLKYIQLVSKCQIESKHLMLLLLTSYQFTVTLLKCEI